MCSITSIFCCALLVGLATAQKKCDDCVKITECAPASELLRTDRSPAAIKLFQDAHCGFEGVPKVCCSNFLSSRSSNNETENKNNAQTSGNELENHPNIHLLTTDCGAIEGNRIVGGTSAGLYEFPWLALISYKDTGTSLKFKCGGTVITARYVLTAAHCIVGQQLVGVRIGDYDISQAEDCVGEEEIRECETRYQDIAVTHKIFHPEYVKKGYIMNDIGLLRLARAVDFSYSNAGKICLPVTKDLQEKDLVGERGVVAGWGMIDATNKSNILLKVELPIFSQNTCQNFYNSRTNRRGIDTLKNTFCAGEIGHDSCKGDSGGPLMLESNYYDLYKFVQFGVVSYGPRQCGSQKPGVYTDVRKFMKWILDTIKP